MEAQGGRLSDRSRQLSCTCAAVRACVHCMSIMCCMLLLDQACPDVNALSLPDELFN